MNSIKEKIKELKIMKPIVLYRFYKRDKNLQNLIAAYKNESIVLYQENDVGVSIPNKIYHIKIDDPQWGFFACYWWTLNELYFADSFNLTPIVDWTERNAYYEENGINGIKNPFEYYYKPVSEIGIDNLNNKDAIINVLNVRTKKRNTYLFNNDFSDLIRINKKYIKLKPNIETKIMKDIKDIIGPKKTLAVHIRGVEWGNIKGHPIPLKIEEYTKKIDEAMKKYKFEQIFLATDSDENIEYLENKYKDKVVYYKDVARSKKGSKTLALFDSSINRKNNHYLMGLEVLRDMHTLASCDGFIAGFSNISCAVQITKKSNDTKFDYLHIFNQKIQQQGMSSGEAVKKMKNGNFEG